MSDVAAPVVATSAGRVRGVDRGSHLSFHGIPYAAPPVGERRFRPAAAADPWDGVRDATRPGPVAPQEFDREFRERMGVPELPQSEAASLHLTVHTPGLEGAAPVFVWIHGGSFTTGSSSWSVHDPAMFARDGVVGVSINYRLAAFGFLDLREFDGDDAEPNLALTDAIRALEWIRDEIARFGGDPSRVTIAGESAGAGMVTALLASPLADGLFHRAVLQSGVNFRMQDRRASARIAANLLAALGVDPGDRRALEAVPADEIVRAGADRARILDGVEGARLAWCTHQDDHSQPRTLNRRLESGELAHIELLLGTTADENKLMWLTAEPPGDDGAYPRVHARADELRSVYRRAERGRVEWEIDESIVNDGSYLVPTTRAAEKHATAGGRAYLYMFTWRSPVLGGRLGSCHALENAFMFDSFVSPLFHGEHPPRRLAQIVHGAWAEFARHGAPAAAGLPDWPRYDLDDPVTMELGETVGPVRRNRWSEYRAWNGVPDDELGVG